MLLAFRAANVRSFRDALELSLLATTRAEPRVVRQVSWREGGQPLGVLPAAGIFGANGSGKSNLLEAMDDMRFYVVNSFRRTGEMLPRWPFRLDPDFEVRPSRVRDRHRAWRRSPRVRFRARRRAGPRGVGRPLPARQGGAALQSQA